jgi:hypothetical protein
MSQRLVLIGLLIALLVVGVWWNAQQQRAVFFAEFHVSSTARYHELETQVYATWTPE